MMQDIWPDLKSSARAFMLSWLLILTPIFAVATIIHAINPEALRSDF